MFERAQAALRRRGRQGVFEYERRTGRFLRRVFANPLPLPYLDAEALGAAEGLADGLVMDFGRARRVIATARSAGALPYAVVGDSHSTQRVRRSLRDGRWLLPIHRLCTGATARGLSNPAAAAGAGAKAAAILPALTELGVPTLFQFGQVDVEFVAVFKRLETGAGRFDPAAFEAFAAETVERYLGFLAASVPAALKPHAWIAGVFPPALSDAAWRRGYVDAHIADLHGPPDVALADRLAEVEIPPLAARTRLHGWFNARLFEAARAEGFPVLDDFAPMLDRRGVVRGGLLGRARGRNHHLGYAASRGAVIEGLWTVAAS